MDKRDALFLIGILVGVGAPVTWVALIANGIIDSPIK